MADIGKKRILAALDGSRASMDTVVILNRGVVGRGGAVDIGGQYKPGFTFYRHHP